MKFISSRLFAYISLSLIFLIISFSLIWYLMTKRAFDAWNLMPNNPILILESLQVLGFYQDLEKQTLWENLKNTAYFGETNDKVNFLKQVFETEKGFLEFFKDKKFTASLHLVSKEDVGFLFFIPLKKSTDKDFFNQLLTKFQKDKNFYFQKRTLQGVLIQEITNTNATESFFLINHQNFAIGTYSPILIEDVARKIAQSENAFAFKQQKKVDRLMQVADEKKGKLNIYVNIPQLTEFLKITAKEDLASFIKPLALFSENIFLKTVKATGFEDFEGESFATEKDSSLFLNIFKGQKTQNFSLKNFVPANTAILYHFAFENTNRFVQSLKTYYQKDKSPFLERQSAFEKEQNIQLNDFYKNLEKEIAFCILESNDPSNANKLLFLKSNLLPVSLSFLQKISNQVATKQQIAPQSQKYGTHLIHEIKISEFPALLLGDLVEGFERCYFTGIGQSIVLANDIRLLENLIDDIKANRVLAQVGASQDLLKLFNPQANFNFIIQTAKVWNIFYENASPSWKKIIADYESAFKNIACLGFQFSQKDNRFFTKFAFNIGTSTILNRENIPVGYQALTQATLKQNVFSPPFLVRNHEDNSQETLVQDGINYLYLLSQEGKMLWNRKMDSPIRSEPIQIDIYDNERLQYALLTNNRIHLIDRLGRNVPRFPLYVVDGDSAKLNSLAVLDFDKDKNYHFLVSTERGKLYMLDKQRKFVKGWRPKTLRYRLATPAQFTKVAGKDYIILAQADGVIHALDKEGNEHSGFPITLNSDVSQPLWIDEGLDASATFLTCFTDNGELIKFNLIGEKIKEEQLYRPSGDAKFSICADKKNKDWILAVTDRDFVGVFNKSGQRIMEQKFDSKNDDWIVQYFNLDSDTKIIAITDKSASKTYLFDLKGRELAEAIQSNTAVQLRYIPKENKLIIYRCYGKTVGSLSLNLK